MQTLWYRSTISLRLDFSIRPLRLFPQIMQCRTDLIMVYYILRTLCVSLGRYTFNFFLSLPFSLPSFFLLFFGSYWYWFVNVKTIGSLPRTACALNSSHISFRFWNVCQYFESWRRQWHTRSHTIHLYTTSDNDTEKVHLTFCASPFWVYSLSKHMSV